MISAIQVLAPPTGNLVSTELVRRHLRIDIDTDEDDLLLPIYIDSARLSAENYTARAIGQQKLRWSIVAQNSFQQFPLLGLPAQQIILPQWLNPELLNQRPIELPRQPIISVDSVSQGDIGGPFSVLDPSQYVFDPITCQFRLNGYSGFGFNSSLLIDFTAGYTFDNCPKSIIHAILLMIADSYENRGDVSTEIDNRELRNGSVSMMNNAVIRLLTPYRLVTFGA